MASFSLFLMFAVCLLALCSCVEVKTTKGSFIGEENTNLKLSVFMGKKEAKCCRQFSLKSYAYPCLNIGILCVVLCTQTLSRTESMAVWFAFVISTKRYIVSIFQEYLMLSHRSEICVLLNLNPLISLMRCSMQTAPAKFALNC